MKLYEFYCSFNDSLNLTEEEVLVRIQKILEEEALLQRWSPGYELKQSKRVESFKFGGKQYFFLIEGEFLPIDEEEGHEE